MSRLITRFKYSLLLSSLLLLSGLLPIFLLRARWDPEPHHDGVIYAAAVAVRDGLAPNRDVFAQYGPLVPEIQGLWLREFGPALLNLRILNALLLAAIGLMLFNLCKKRIGIITSALVTFAWAFASPRPCQQTCSNLFTTKLPWPSVFSTLILMISLTLLNSIKMREEKSKIRILVFGGVGFLLMVGGFSRIQLFASVVFVVLLMFWKLERKKFRNDKYPFLLGGILSILVSVLLLIKFGIWQSFLDQCIFWSFHKYGETPLSATTFIDILWFLGVALIFMGIWVITSRAIQYQNSILKFLFLITPSAIFILAAIILNIGRNKSSYLIGRNGNFLVDISSNVLSGLGYSSVIYILYKVIPKFARRSTSESFEIENDLSLDPVRIVCLGIAASALFQLYPFFDPLHLWWITPVLIGGILSSCPSASASIRFKQLVARAILIGLVLSGIFQLVVDTEANRVAFHDVALHGMTASPDEVRRVDSTMLMLSKFGIPRHIKFFCADGLYAAAGGKYLASDGNFVNWAPTTSRGDQAGGYSQIFVCNVKARAIKDFQDIGWKLISKTAVEPGYGVSALFKIG